MNNNQLYLIINNVRSAHNVGSMLRTADGSGVSKVFICGFSPKPDHIRVAKTALGAEKTVPWEHHARLSTLIKKLKKQGVQVVALETAKNSVNIFSYKPKFPLAIIVGHEKTGLSPATLRAVDAIIEIPMLGTKESLNVSVATGIALYSLQKL